MKKLSYKRAPFYVFCDVETTSTSKKNGEIIALSLVVADSDLKECGSYTGYARPKTFDHWNYYAEKNVHKISKSQASQFPEARATLIEVLQFLIPYKQEDDSPIPFIYHGKNKIDYNLLRIMFDREGLAGSFDKVFSNNYVISTCEMFVFFTGLFGAHTVDHKLNTMASFFDISLDHHEAESDTKACYLGYKAMVEHFKL